MRVALVGPPQSGKSSVFAAVAQAGGSHVDIHRPDQPHLAVVKVPDERLEWLAEHYGVPKAVAAELEFLDLPGFDLTSESGRTAAKAHWPTMRQSDMLAFVVRSFDDSLVAAYRQRVDPAGDVGELLEEMIFADLEQAAGRIEKLTAALAKSGNPHRRENEKELELMQRVREALENSQPISQAVTDPQDDKLLRSFAFLSQKPALAVLNCGEQADSDEKQGLCSLPCVRLSAKIEAELSQLPPADRAEFMAELGIAEGARDKLIAACCRRMNMVSFLTVGKSECRAWSIPAGTDAVTAAGHVHTDMARGFIRAETVAFDDLRAAGDMKAAKAAGKVRLEGKAYIVQDGDVINFRFNV